MARPTAQQYVFLRNSAMNAAGGQDLDLPPGGRRTRSTFIDGRPLTPGTAITLVGIGEATVLGPGRGASYFLAGWMEGTTACYGTFLTENIA